MLKDHLKTKSITFDSGKTTLSLEPTYWMLLDYLADQQGYRDWRDWLYDALDAEYKGDISVAAYTRRAVTIAVANDLHDFKRKYDPMTRELKKFAL